MRTEFIPQNGGLFDQLIIKAHAKLCKFRRGSQPCHDRTLGGSQSLQQQHIHRPLTHR